MSSSAGPGEDVGEVASMKVSFEPTIFDAHFYPVLTLATGMGKTSTVLGSTALEMHAWGEPALIFLGALGSWGV